MHIHVYENPARFAPCRSDREIPYVSLETISEFSNMSMNMTREWLRVEIEIKTTSPTHVYDGVTYLPAHAILQYLTTEERPSGKADPRRQLLDIDQALDLLTAKLGKYLAPWAQHHQPVEVRQALRTILKRDAILNVGCGAAIPV